MTAQQNRWQRKELLAAFNLYCQIPFGKMHRSNPDIVALAKLLGRTASAVAMKLVNFASLDPAITSTGRVGLNNASAADRAVWEEFHGDWEQLALESAEITMRLENNHEASTTKSVPASLSNNSTYEGTTRNVVTAARVKQAFFRKSVLSSYQNRCCMSSLIEPELLIASHIVPWSVDKSNRLNPRNGLCLSTLHDRAYDLGLLTVTPEYRIKVSKRLKAQSRIAMIKAGIVDLDGRKIQLPDKFWPDPEFLDWHLKNRFERRENA